MILTADVSERVAHLRRVGWNVTDIARQVGVTSTAVWAWAAGRNRPSDERWAVLKDLPDESPSQRAQKDREAAMVIVSNHLDTLQARGWTVQQIAHRLGLHRDTVRTYSQLSALPAEANRAKLSGLLDEPSPRTAEETLLASMALAIGDGHIYDQGMARLSLISGFSEAQVSRLLRRMHVDGIITRLNNEPGMKRRWRLNWKPAVTKTTRDPRWEEVND